MSQAANILAHLRTGASLTPLGALSLFGCLRLSGRILELRRQGHAIETHTVRTGRKAFAEYKLSSEPVMATDTVASESGANNPEASRACAAGEIPALNYAAQGPQQEAPSGVMESGTDGRPKARNESGSYIVPAAPLAKQEKAA